MKRIALFLGICSSVLGAESLTMDTYGRLTYPSTFWQWNDAGFTKAIDRRYTQLQWGDTAGVGANVLRAQVGAAQGAHSSEMFYMNFFGDSWIHGSLNDTPTWYEILVRRAKQVLGDKWAGYGYLPATSGPSPGQVPYPRLVPVSYTGPWIATGVSTVGRGPSPMHMNSTNESDIITWTFPDSIPTTLNIIYAKATGGGEFAWRFNHADDTNAWSAPVATDAADSIGVVSITSGFPDYAPFTLDIVATNNSPTAGVRICGLFHQSATNGLIMNNLAAQGASIKKYDDWLTNTTTWITAFDTGMAMPTGTNRVVNLLCFGINDILDSSTTNLVNRMNNFIAAMEDANGTGAYTNMEWVVIFPCETGRANGTPPYPLRVTEYFTYAAPSYSSLILATDRIPVPLINADNWFGNSAAAGMAQWLDSPSGIHLNFYGTGIFATHMAEYLGL